MKKALSIVLCCVFLITGLVSCGQGKTNSLTSIEEFKTVGDVLSNYQSDFQSSAKPDIYVCIFTFDDVLYRAMAFMPEGLYEKLEALDFSDPKYDEKEAKLIKDLELDEIQNLSELIPAAQDRINSFIGKTGLDLLFAGYKTAGHFDNDGKTVFYIENNLFLFSVTFKEEVQIDDEADEEEVIKPLTVESVEYTSTSSMATTIEIS